MWLGVDGGASKTEALVADQGRILGFARGGPSNHQGVGLDGATQSVAAVVLDALKASGVRLADIRRAVLGLAGADFPTDILRLNEALTPIFGHVPFQVVNDAEIGLAAGTDQGFGICAIAGTGTNVLGRTQAGVIRQVGGLGYEFGDLGSGIQIAEDVLHAAFRSAELRGPKTQLEAIVLSVFGQPDYQALSWAMYDRQIPRMAFLLLVPLCFQAARDEDAVAQQILARQGQSIGQSIVGCARLLGMDRAPFDVVLAGSLWLGVAPHMKDAALAVISRETPGATVRVTELRPVAGAVLMAAQDDGWGDGPMRHLLMEDVRLRGVE
jgi:N-acetylglucosamine kinase-like BadF-type ATPase